MKRRPNRTQVVSARFTPEERAVMEQMRGAMTESAWLRWLQLKAAKEWAAERNLDV